MKNSLAFDSIVSISPSERGDAKALAGAREGGSGSMDLLPLVVMVVFDG